MACGVSLGSPAARRRRAPLAAWRAHPRPQLSASQRPRLAHLQPVALLLKHSCMQCINAETVQPSSPSAAPPLSTPSRQPRRRSTHSSLAASRHSATGLPPR